MRVTKKQLRRIVKEEKTKILAEERVRHIVRRILLEQSEGPYPPGYHVIEFSDGKQYVDSWVKKQGRPPLMGLYHDFKTKRNKVVSVEELPEIYTDAASAGWMAPKGKAVAVNDILSRLDPSDPKYQLVDKAASEKAGVKSKGHDDLSWESLLDHPQWDEGMSDVAAAAKQNGVDVNAYMDEDTSPAEDLVQLEKAFKETKRINFDTAMDSGTIIIGTFNGQPAAVWDVMGYQTWMY